MSCAWCGYHTSAEASFCGNCGRGLRFKSVCGSCGGANPEHNRFCDACGGTLAVASPQTRGGQATRRGPLVLHPSQRRSEPWSRVELGFLIGLTAAGAALRLALLGDIPPGLHGDEAWTGLEASRILRDGPIGVWSPSALGQPAGLFYWTGFLFLFLEPGLLSLRLSTALLGVLTVPAFYLFARALIGRGPAALGTALLAVSYWHLHYSRISFPVVALPLVECVALYLLVRGLREGRMGLVAAAGAASALGVYVYGGSVGFALALALFWGFLVLGGAYSPRELARRALLFLVPALIVSAPFLHTVLGEPARVFSYGTISSTFNDPSYVEAETTVEKAGFVLRRLLGGFAVYAVGRVVDFTDGMGARGLLDPLTLALLALGTAAAVWRWREWPRFLLLAGLIAGVLVTAYMALPTWAENRRGIAALPMVFALAGVGGEAVVGWMARWVDRRWAYALLGVVVVIAAGLNLSYYFGPLANAPETRWVFAEEIARASQYVKGLPDEDLYVYFYSGRWSYQYETRRFLLPDVPGEDRSREFGEYSLDRGEEHPRALFLLQGPYSGVVQDLRDLYPTGRYHEEREDGRFLFGAYLVEESP